MQTASGDRPKQRGLSPDFFLLQLKNPVFQTLYIKSLGKFLNVLEFGDILYA